MIKVEAINGEPSVTPREFIGSHFDGHYFYFFESEQERIDFFADLPKAWSKEAHLAEINALHEAEFERRWLAADYKTERELSRALANPLNEYHEEAKLIDAYWWSGWAAIKAYGDTLTEQPTETPQEFFIQLNSTL